MIIHTVGDVLTKSIGIQLSDATGVPYYRQIVDQLGELIRAGNLPPNSRLPSVRELAAELMVSLITIRRAYAELEHARFVVRRQGHGTYVSAGFENATAEQSLAQGRTVIREAVAKARRLGLSDGELQQLFAQLLNQGGADHE